MSVLWLIFYIFGCSLGELFPIRPPSPPPSPPKMHCQPDSCRAAEWCEPIGSSIVCIKPTPCNHLEDCPAKYSCQYDYNTLWKFCYPIVCDTVSCPPGTQCVEWGHLKGKCVNLGCPGGACPLPLKCGVVREQMVCVPK